MKPTCAEGFVTAVNERGVKDNSVIMHLDLSMSSTASIDVEEITMEPYVALCYQMRQLPKLLAIGISLYKWNGVRSCCAAEDGIEVRFS